MKFEKSIPLQKIAMIMFLRMTFFFILVFSLGYNGIGQQHVKKGNIVIVKNNRVDTLISVQKTINTESHFFNGFRIQVFSESGNNSRARAMEVQSFFAKNNPELHAYLSFVEPYYKVRVGNFKTRIEAEEVLTSLTKMYPAAFIVADKIIFSPTDNIIVQGIDLE